LKFSQVCFSRSRTRYETESINYFDLLKISKIVSWIEI